MSEEQYEEISIRKEIEVLISREPFQPFVIVMASGDRYAIDGEKEAVFSKDAITLAPGRTGGFNVLRFAQVSSIEVPEPK